MARGLMPTTVSRSGIVAAAVAVSQIGCAHAYERWSPRALHDEGSVNGDESDARADSSDEATTILDDAYARNRRLRIQGIVLGSGNVDRAARVAAQNRTLRQACFGDEIDLIRAASRDDRFGVALSGGGIRSAAFSEGVLQGIHEIGGLSRVGYLSTVSGGGFTGAWYETHRQDDNELFRPGSPHLDHLAQSGSYLDVGGVDSQFRTYLKASGIFAVGIPYHVMLNDIFSLGAVVPGIRLLYMQGQQAAFMYAAPGSLYPSPAAHWSLGELPPSIGEASEDTEWQTAMVGHETRPYWIVNCHVALTDDVHHRLRAGDAFEITPVRSGADTVGYVRTAKRRAGVQDVEAGAVGMYPFTRSMERYAGFWMQTNFAVAASAAAFDTASRRGLGLVDDARRYLNLDLGYPIPGWSSGWLPGDGGTAMQLRHHITSFIPFGLGSYLDGGTHRRDAEGADYYLTDGGHFENLGLYALVRRGCRLIIVSDATHDSNVEQWGDGQESERAKSFEDLRIAEERMLADFGARMRIEWGSFHPGVAADASQPVTVSRNSDLVNLSDGRVVVASIDNLPISGEAERTIVLIVRASDGRRRDLRCENSSIDRERARNPAFPNDPTEDQFFDETRVIAYRELGREIVVANQDLIRQAASQVGIAWSPGASEPVHLATGSGSK